MIARPVLISIRLAGSGTGEALIATEAALIVVAFWNSPNCESCRISPLKENAALPGPVAVNPSIASVPLPLTPGTGPNRNPNVLMSFH